MGEAVLRHAVVTENKPRLVCPPGATDCHMHFYGARAAYPLAPTCPIPPPLASVAAYRRLMARLGLERVVIVQPSAYGKDNRCTLDALAELGAAARAVVVVDETATEAELARLTGLGVRGIRFFMLPGGVLPWDILEEMAARVAPFGWHVQLQLDGRELPVEIGRCWVKVSAPYETSRVGPPGYDDVGALARALIAAAPERMLWASNWPHPTAQDDPPDDAVLLDLLLDWAGDEATRRAILADNPAALYGFAPAGP